MRDRRLASNYAEALLGLLDAGEAAAADTLLEGLAAAFRDGGGFRNLMRDPAIDREVRKKVLVGIADASSAPRSVRNFLAIIADHNRTVALPSIAERFHQLREERLGIVRVEMATAVPLSDDLRRRTESALAHRTGHEVRVSYRVQPELIGGAVARVGSRIYDGSLRTQIAQLRQRMAQD